MAKKKNKIPLTRVISILTVIFILMLWWIASAMGWTNPKLIPAPLDTWKEFLKICKDGYGGYTLLQHIWASMQRLLIAFGWAVVFAIPLGLISGFSKIVRAILEPIIEFYRPLPPLAYYALLTLGLGIGEKSKIALLFLACFAPIYVSCVSAVVRIREDYINAAYTVGANKGQVFWHVIFPSCLPDMFVGLRTAVGVAYTTLVAAEMVAASVGLGWMVLDASNWFKPQVVFIGIIIMGITGIIIDSGLKYVEKKLVPWSGKD